jgi:K(+)-stimulated pyrophosphate-energized sodium pump
VSYPKEVSTYRYFRSVGNTTAATGKGFAIASAALTSFFICICTFTGIDGINILKHQY